MRIVAEVVRVYGSHSYYGELPRTPPVDKPAVLESFPDVGDHTVVILGDLPADVVRARTRARALGQLLMETIFTKSAPTDIWEREQLFTKYVDENAATDFGQGLSWFVTLVIRREIEVQEEDVFDNDPIQWLGYQAAMQHERQLRTALAPYMDLLTTYLTVLLESHSLEVKVIDDHVSYLRESKEPLNWPHFTGEAGLATISVGNQSFDAQLAESMFVGLANLPQHRHAWLLTLSRWYIRCLNEQDPWKRFLWSYMSLEILFNKQWTKAFDNVLSALTHTGADGVVRSAVDLPVTEVMYSKQDPGRVPVTAKFAFLALSLFPDRASADLELFRELKEARDGISHGSWQFANDPPAGKSVEFLKRYLAAAIRYELGINLA